MVSEYTPSLELGRATNTEDFTSDFGAEIFVSTDNGEENFDEGLVLSN